MFGSRAELYLCAIKEKETVIGIAPLLLREGTASFIGSADVCDYLDFVVAPKREQDFFDALLDSLKQKGITRMDLTASLSSEEFYQLSSILEKLRDTALKELQTGPVSGGN